MAINDMNIKGTLFTKSDKKEILSGLFFVNI